MTRQAVSLFWQVKLLDMQQCRWLRRLGGNARERNARLLALALCDRFGRPVFQSAGSVQRWLTGWQIERYALAWLRLMQAQCPPLTLARVETRMETLRRDGAARLQHQLSPARVLRYESELLDEAALLLLDEEEALARLCPACRVQAERRGCPVCGADGVQGGYNAGFDEERFARLRGGEGA